MMLLDDPNKGDHMNRSVLAALALLLAGCYSSYERTGVHDATVEPDPDPDPDPEPIEDPAIEDPAIEDPVIEDPLEEVCAETAFAAWRVVPDVLIALDRSNSMYDTPPWPRMWDTIRNALYDITEPPRDAAIWFGLLVFPGPSCRPGDPDPVTGCQAPVPSEINVRVGADRHDEIETALTSMSTCGGTPIAETLQAAGRYLNGLSDHHQKYVLLATDGAPNCNLALDGDSCTCTSSYSCSMANWNCLDDARTYAILDDMCADGIETYVLGLGAAAEWEAVQAEMASHGCTDDYYLAEEPDEIERALEDIAADVETCQIEMYCRDVSHADEVNFYTLPGGAVVPRDTSRTAGWDWIDPCGPGVSIGLVEFFGLDCDVLLSDDLARLEGTSGCPTIGG